MLFSSPRWKLTAADINLRTVGCGVAAAFFRCAFSQLECSHCYIFLDSFGTTHGYCYSNAVTAAAAAATHRFHRHNRSNFHFMSPSWRPYHFLYTDFEFREIHCPPAPVCLWIFKGIRVAFSLNTLCRCVGLSTTLSLLGPPVSVSLAVLLILARIFVLTTVLNHCFM